jgi:hypothetical protein
MIVKIWSRTWAQVDESDPKKNTVQHKTDSRIEVKKKGSYDPLIYVGVFISPPPRYQRHLLDCNALHHSNATNV